MGKKRLTKEERYELESEKWDEATLEDNDDNMEDYDDSLSQDTLLPSERFFNGDTELDFEI